MGALQRQGREREGEREMLAPRLCPSPPRWTPPLLGRAELGFVLLTQSVLKQGGS